VDEDVLAVLATANIHSPDDLIKTPIEVIATTTGIDMGDSHGCAAQSAARVSA